LSADKAVQGRKPVANGSEMSAPEPRALASGIR